MLLEAFASVIDDRMAIYVSSPLTTGARAFEWHRNHAAARSFAEDVIEPNREEAAAFARGLRQATARVVIDPTAMGDLPGWEQRDFRYFWGRVIVGYCSEVVFRDGWQFS